MCMAADPFKYERDRSRGASTSDLSKHKLVAKTRG